MGKFKDKKEKKKLKRDLDFFEDDLIYLLKLVFVRKEISEEQLSKKLRLRDKERLELLSDYASSAVRRYIEIENKKGVYIYTITNRGIDYLLLSKRAKKEEKNAKAIKIATFVIAIAALIQAIDIWIYKPQTKETILILITNVIGATLTFIKDLIPIVLIILVAFILFKIYKKIKHKKTP